MQSSGAEWVLAAVVGGALLLLLLQAAYSVPSWNTPPPAETPVQLAATHTSTPIGLALAGVRVDKLAVTDPQRQRGLSGYLLPFVIVSVHLLVVLIGAGYLARTKRYVPGSASTWRGLEDQP
jgi:NADH-quinone oxidoreductase subunit J